jgi:hypothetical protein
VSKDVLLQTRVPSRVAREVKRRAGEDSSSEAAWLRRLLVREIEADAQAEQKSEFFWLGHLFIRKSAVIEMIWGDPHAGSCASGEKPWELCVRLVDGSVTRLSTTPAKIVLEAFGLPSANPHPNGTKR